MSTPWAKPEDDADDDIGQARRMREDLAVREAETQELITQAVPSWRRLRVRTVQNSFGEEYELSLVRRGRE